MKILSNFKDYYDYLAWQYGVDDNIVFHRNRLLALPAPTEHLHLPECFSPGEENFRPENEKYEYHLGSTNWFYYESRGKICQFECVSIVGTLYYYVYEYDKYSKKASGV